MFGASLMKVMHFGLHFSGYELGMLLLGMFTAFLVSVLVIRFLMDYIRKHDFKPFCNSHSYSKTVTLHLVKDTQQHHPRCRRAYL